MLLAEHEPEVAEMAARYLRRDGLQVRLVTAGEPALAGLTGGRDDAAVLDLTMPGLDPSRIRRALRGPRGPSGAEGVWGERLPSQGGARGARGDGKSPQDQGGSRGDRPPETTPPVIFLVAGPRPRGLAGARGGATRRWLSRPFSPRQLVALVREVLAEPVGPAAPPGGGVAGLWLDGRGRTVAVGGRRVPLTATEFAVLAALAGNAGRVLTRRQLLAAAGRAGPGDRAADVYIAQLRAKLGPAAVIRTVRGVGYAFGRLSGGAGRAAPTAGLPSGGSSAEPMVRGRANRGECARRDPGRRPRRSRRMAATCLA